MPILEVERVNQIAESDLIGGLDLSMFSEEDILNTILQRSEILFDSDRPGRLIKRWSNGDAVPLVAEVEARGALLLRRAISVLYLEYEALKPTLDRIQPKRVADIGCGYGFINLFISRDYGSETLLIDLEQNDHTHFGYQSEGAAYSNLGTAKRFLAANGVPSSSIRTMNPKVDDLSEVEDIDLAMSLLSCGFHYPVSTYADFWLKSVRKTGSIILDLRTAHTENQLTDMINLGAVRSLWKGKKWNRVLVQKFDD